MFAELNPASMRVRFRLCVVVAVLIHCISLKAADLDLGKLPPASAGPAAFEPAIKPLLERSCLPCHGFERAKAHFRVDSREGLLKGGESHQAAVIPGNSAGSPLVRNAAGLVKEMEMPPLDKRDRYPALSPAEIGLVRSWIDQGVTWPDGVTLQKAARTSPDEVADASPEHPSVDILFEQIRRGERAAIARRLGDAACLELRDERGNTPLIQAAFYLDAEMLRCFLERGANPNARNGAGVTALMKAVSDVRKTRLLLEHGAEVNAASGDKNTALVIACYACGSGKVVAELLARGADIRPKNHLGANAIRAAAEAGDLEVLRLLLDRGGDPNSTGLTAESNLPITALMIAAQLGHLDCVKLLLDRGAAVNCNTGHGNALAFAVFTERRDIVGLLLEQGADVNTAGRRIASFRKDTGFTPLMYAALNEHNDATIVEWLLARGAEVNVKSSTGETALELARLRGNTKIVAALKAAGAEAGVPAADDSPALALWNAPQIAGRNLEVLRKAAESGLSLLLKSSVRLSEATGNRCFTCHQHAQPTLAWSLARQKGFDYPKDLAAGLLEDELRVARRRTDNAIQEPVPVPNIAGWFLVGLDAAHYPADSLTDDWAYALSRFQSRDGRWISRTARAPTDYSDVTSTAIAIRALKAYAPPTMKAPFADRIARAASWLRVFEPRTTEERALQLLGLLWAGEKGSKLSHRAQALLDEQRRDGGWAQLPTLESDAYATGLALYTLHQVGLKISQPFYQRGIDYLLQQQCSDGSWLVHTRASPVQVAIENIFPHGKDQWISSDATSWSTMALMLACGPDLAATGKTGQGAQLRAKRAMAK